MREEIVTQVLEHVDAYAIYLFGSAARNEQRLESDLDIAFLSDQSYSSYECFEYGEKLARRFGCDVDLVDMKQASTVLQKEIIAHAKLLLDERPYERQMFTIRVLKEYAYLNVQRACEASIDLAMHVVTIRGLGIPNTSREAFQLLEEKNDLDLQLSERMQKMVGFRNVAIHDYQRMRLPVLQAIVEEHLDDFTDFAEAVKE